MNAFTLPHAAVRLFGLKLFRGALKLFATPAGKPKLAIVPIRFCVACAGVMTVMDCVCRGAARYAALPAWSAAITHDPAATKLAVFPATVQVAGVRDARLTARP